MENKQYTDDEKIAYYQNKLLELAHEIGFVQYRIVQLTEKKKDQNWKSGLKKSRKAR